MELHSPYILLFFIHSLEKCCSFKIATNHQIILSYWKSQAAILDSPKARETKSECVKQLIISQDPAGVCCSLLVSNNCIKKKKKESLKSFDRLRFMLEKLQHLDDGGLYDSHTSYRAFTALHCSADVPEPAGFHSEELVAWGAIVFTRARLRLGKKWHINNIFSHTAAD